MFSLLWKKRGEGEGARAKGYKAPRSKPMSAHACSITTPRSRSWPKKTNVSPGQGHADSTRVQVTVKPPPFLGGPRPHQPASQPASAREHVHNQSPPPPKVNDQSQPSASVRTQPKKTPNLKKKKTTLGLHTHRLT